LNGKTISGLGIEFQAYRHTSSDLADSRPTGILAEAQLTPGLQAHHQRPGWLQAYRHTRSGPADSRPTGTLDQT
jgi:hypothetical protein